MSENHTFLITFSVPGGVDADGLAARVYDDERLQDMALIGPDEHGGFQADFERGPGSFGRAVASAVRDLIGVVPEAEVSRVEHDSLVTIAAIARRLNRKHETVRLYARNRRGPGTFPPPVDKIDAKTEVWSWVDVARWWEEEMGEQVPRLREDVFLTILNDALEIRRLAGSTAMEPEESAAVAAVLPAEIAGAAAGARQATGLG